MQIHPSEIGPGELFDIFYFIRNHTDAATYYIQAKIYDVKDGSLLATHNLSQSSANPRLFIKTIEAPADPVGYGRNIVAIATVYTDSGYTTKSDAYEEQEQYYLIKAAPLQLGGGGVDYRALREIVSEELEKSVGTLPKPEKVTIPEQDKTPFQAILGALETLKQAVAAIPRADLSPVLTALRDIRQAISALPEPEQLDLSPALEKMEQLERALEAGLEDMQDKIDDGHKRFFKMQDSYMETFGDRLAESSEKAIKEAAKRVDLHLTLPLQAAVGAKERKETAEPLDLSHLYA